MTPRPIELAIAEKLEEINELLAEHDYDNSYLSMFIARDHACNAVYLQFNNEYWDKHMSQPINYRRYL